MKLEEGGYYLLIENGIHSFSEIISIEYGEVFFNRCTMVDSIPASTKEVLTIDEFNELRVRDE
jgi:hypothetical protein